MIRCSLEHMLHNDLPIAGRVDSHEKDYRSVREELPESVCFSLSLTSSKDTHGHFPVSEYREGQVPA